MWKKCKHCCCLHGFELKSFSFPLRTSEHDDSMSSDYNEMFSERHKNDSIWHQSTHPHTHTHGPVNGDWHKHLALV